MVIASPEAPMGAGVAVEFVNAEVIATSSSARSPSSGAYAFVLDVRCDSVAELRAAAGAFRAAAAHFTFEPELLMELRLGADVH